MLFFNTGEILKSPQYTTLLPTQIYTLHKDIKMSEKRIIRRRRTGSTGSDSEDEDKVVLSDASQEEGVSKNLYMFRLHTVKSLLGWVGNTSHYGIKV